MCSARSSSSFILPPSSFRHAVIPLVSAMNAVSRLISSSLNSVSLKPPAISSVARSL